MTKQEILKNCLYYKGETEEPSMRDFGFWYWWAEERRTVESKQDKQPKKLSDTMKSHIRKLWEDYGGPSENITLDEALKRAEEMYLKCAFDVDYIRDINHELNPDSD